MEKYNAAFRELSGLSHDLVVATLDTCFMERRLLHIIFRVHGIHIGFVFEECLKDGNDGECREKPWVSRCLGHVWAPQDSDEL